jgi:hypothetical protein
MSILRICALLVVGVLALGESRAEVAVPEVLMAFPAANSGGNTYLGFTRGRAVNAAGDVIPAAYFTLASSVPQSKRLWVTDGTAAGTHLAANNEISGSQAVSTDVGLFYTAYDGDGNLQVFRTTGLEASAHALTQETVQATSLKGVIGNDALLSRPGPTGQTAAWRLNGDTGAETLMGLFPGSGTEWTTTNQHALVIGYLNADYALNSLPESGAPLYQIPVPVPSTYWDYPHRMGAGNRIACFKAFTHYSATDIRQELNCTDGTAQGTRVPRPVAGGFGVPLMDGVSFQAVGDKLLMVDGVLGSVWITDGSDAGTFALIDGYTERWYSCSDDTSGKALLVANRGGENQLWLSDGSRSGTRNILSFPTVQYYCGKKGTAVPGTSLSYLQVGAYFQNGPYLFRTDGTAEGSMSVFGSPELLDHGPRDDSVQGIVVLGRWLVFAAPVSETQDGLWRLDLDPVFSDGMGN